MWIADGWKDYEVIDCSEGEKLERWGNYTLVRPDPQVIWSTPKTEKLGTELYQRMNGFFDLPDLSLGAAAIGGRIHDDSVIMIPAPDFPFHELDAVVYDPADRSRFKT